MRRSDTTGRKSDPMDLDRHFIDLNDYMFDMSDITDEEQKFGLKFLKGLGVYLENQEILQISATPEAIFCLVVKSFRRLKI
jgi:hypothetical protein